MKTGTKRCLALLVALMLVVGNTMAAARACVIEFSGPQHGPMQLAEAMSEDAQQHLCPPAADRDSASDHCRQAHQHDGQKYSHDGQPAVAATAPALRSVRLPVAPLVARLDYRSPVGPPLTILYGHFLI